jgi:Resolvase, N terminal domain
MSPEKLKPLVGYVRVSTSQQGRSGLGLDAQKQALERFAEAEGFTLRRVFVEVETAKGFDALERRPQVAAGGPEGHYTISIMLPCAAAMQLLFQLAAGHPAKGIHQDHLRR